MENFLSIIKWAWCLFLVVLFVDKLRHEVLQQNLLILYRVVRSPRLLVYNFGVLFTMLILAAGLIHLIPWLKWNWLSLFVPDRPPTSLVALPAEINWFAPFFLALLILVMPSIVQIEERIFRKGTRNWRQAFGRSLFFGLLHSVIMAVPFAAGLSITVVGLWLSFCYFQGGLERSILNHVAYNFLVGVILIAASFF